MDDDWGRKFLFFFLGIELSSVDRAFWEFTILESSFKGVENLLTVINSGFGFFDSGVSDDDRLRLDVFFDLGNSKLSSLVSSKSISEELNTSLDTFCIRLSCGVFE